LRLEDLEDEVLFAETAGAGEFQRSGDLGQLRNILFFQFCDGHIHLRLDFSGGILSGKFCRRVGTRRGRLSSPPLCFGKVFWFTQNVMTLGNGNFVENVIHGFLNAGIRSMELPGCLRGKLAEHIPVPQSMERVKNTIRAHSGWFSF
jgi:hypothetical protein